MKMKRRFNERRFNRGDPQLEGNIVLPKRAVMDLLVALRGKAMLDFQSDRLGGYTIYSQEANCYIGLQTERGLWSEAYKMYLFDTFSGKTETVMEWRGLNIEELERDIYDALDVAENELHV